MFARSIDDFYAYVTIDNTGTYPNAYMLVDAYKGEFGMKQDESVDFVPRSLPGRGAYRHQGVKK